ncbi:MFS transporter [Sphingobium subterraneum]|uniref:MFS family permease n=1 Tax=Sphingobium subterraneum TaxID=627688 RepID=A0A841J1J9_9SPHN|nr:MFS family permease [Sphingobium subterraneum]
MIAPIETELSWSRAEITSGLFIVSLLVLPLSPLVGTAIDRHGPRRLAILGIIIYSLSLAGLSLAQHAIWTWWLLWLPLSIGILCLKPTVWVAAISSLFHTHRGLAIACALGATGLMSSVAPSFTNYLVGQFGWRAAYGVWGAITLAVALPVVYTFFTSARDQSRSATGGGPTAHGLPHLDTGEAQRFGRTVMSAPFIKLATVAVLMSVASLAVVVNLVPILSSLGMDVGRAAAVVGIVGVSQLVGRFGGGFLLDRFDARLVGALVAILPAISSVLIVGLGPSIIPVAIGVLMFGLTIGAEVDVIAYLAARFFEGRNFGALFGLIVGLLTLGVGVGPLLASVVYDVTKSYLPVLWAVIPMFITAGVLLLTMGPYPQRRNGSLMPVEEA